MSKPSKRSDLEIEILKTMLCDHIASGVWTTDALECFGVTWRELARWRRVDADFKRDLQDAERHLAMLKADTLTRINEVCSEPKMCNVLSNTWRWRIEKLAPAEFGPKVEAPNDLPARVLDTLREAIARVPLPQDPAVRLIELKPETGHRRIAEPQDRCQS